MPSANCLHLTYATHHALCLLIVWSNHPCGVLVQGAGYSAMDFSGDPQHFPFAGSNNVFWNVYASKIPVPGQRDPSAQRYARRAQRIHGVDWVYNRPAYLQGFAQVVVDMPVDTNSRYVKEVRGPMQPAVGTVWCWLLYGPQPVVHRYAGTQVLLLPLLLLHNIPNCANICEWSYQHFISHATTGAWRCHQCYASS